MDDREIRDRLAAVTRRDVLRWGAAAVALGAVDPLLTACAPANGTQQTTSSNTPANTLVVSVEGDIDTFDPAFTVGSKPAQTTIQNTFDQLTQYQQVDKTIAGVTFKGVDTENIAGMLADSYQAAANTVVFTLRQGLTYQDGTPITAPLIQEGYPRRVGSKGLSSFPLPI